MGDNTLPDQVAGMKELAAKNPWIDISKVGIPLRDPVYGLEGPLTKIWHGITQS
jgi:hypothetical protein